MTALAEMAADTLMTINGQPCVIERASDNFPTPQSSECVVKTALDANGVAVFDQYTITLRRTFDLRRGDLITLLDDAGEPTASYLVLNTATILTALVVFNAKAV